MINHMKKDITFKTPQLREDFLFVAKETNYRTAVHFIELIQQCEKFDKINRKLGGIFPEFWQAVRDAGCRNVNIDAINESPNAGAYQAFSEGEFINEIWLRKENLNTEYIGYTYLTLYHEYIHSIQHKNTAALLATPSNPRTKICLTPSDYLNLHTLMEQDAFVKQAYLITELYAQKPQLFGNDEVDNWIIPIIGTTKKEELDSSKLISSFENYLTNSYIDRYLGRLEERLEDGDFGRFQNNFVRIDHNDIYSVGDTVCENLFTPEHIKNKPYISDITLIMNDEQKTRLQKIEDSLNITNHEKLPTLEEALRKQGMTKQDFLAISRQEAVPQSPKIEQSPQ